MFDKIYKKSRHNFQGGKVIMPPSSLDSLSRLNISFPMLFKIENKNKGLKVTNRKSKMTIDYRII